MTTATSRQIDYALDLLRRAGYPTDWMSDKYRALGTTMGTGSVKVWLRGLTRARISDLIETLVAK